MSQVPTEPTVLDTTVLSNFAYIDRVDLLGELPRVCSVAEVEGELRAGVEAYGHLQSAIDQLGESIPVVDLDHPARELAEDLSGRLDRGEARAFAIAATHDGTFVTDDGPARTLARNRDVPVTGSIGVLVRAVDADRVSAADADRWLTRWIDETAYRAPSRDFSTYL